jgi:outer membrane receptor for Fe3+-dicitrate
MILVSKYEELAKYLEKQDSDLIRMTFQEVEEIIGPLPPTAYDHRAWWANSASQNHAMNGWMSVGWETSQVEMDKQELVFIRAKKVLQDSLLPGYMPKTRSRKLPSPQRDRLNSEFELILNQVGGVVNLSYIIDAIERYMSGELQEMELGQELRRLWARRR